MKRNIQAFYVSPKGNDQWSGKLPDPNRIRTDGPFATLAQARDAIRGIKARGKLPGPITIRMRGGTYYFPETITFTAKDSGTRECPITYAAYPGETPILSGGREISGWRKYRGKILSAQLPEVKDGQWYFRSLFANGERQIRARYPNDDPKVPCRNRFLYVTKTGNEYQRLAVVNLFNAGDWLEYKANIPTAGQYAFWILYSGSNQGFGFTDMNGRVSIRVDDQAPIPLTNLPDTGDSKSFRWGHAATLSLSKGPHTLTLRKEQGGLINIEAFALGADSRWIPRAAPLLESSPRHRRIVIKATDFHKSHGNELLILPLRSELYSETCFPFRPGDVKRSWAREADTEIHIFPSQACRAYMQITQLEQVDEKTHTVKLGGKECVTKLATGDRFFVENVFEELDSPGEWYLNRKTGTLYFWPGKKLSAKSEIVAPRLNRLFHFAGTDNDPIRFIKLSGLTLCETDYSPDGCIGWNMGNNGVVYLQSADDCAVENCLFTNIGDYAVCLSGSRRNAIISNDAAYGGEGGILLFNSADNTISDNHIHHCGRVHKHIGGVVLHGPGSGGNNVSHNLIHDMSRYGISLKNPGQRNVIEYNEVFNTNLETYDTGGIEVTQQDRKFRSHSVIRYNLIHDNIGYSSDMGIDCYLANGIYLDSYAGGYTVSHNIVYRTLTDGIMLQGGKDNKVFNNIVIDSGYQQITIVNFANNSSGLEFTRNIVYYTGAKNLFNAGAISRKILRCDRNLFYHAGNPSLQSFWFGRWGQGIWAEVDFADWQKAGFDQHSIVADPLFVNPKKDDYRLKPESPAFRLGFQPIPIHKIGLLNKRCACSRRSALRDFDTCQLRCSSCRQRRIGGTPCRHLTDVFHARQVSPGADKKRRI